MLGVAYSSGQGVTQDDVEAARWFLKAAEHGYAKAEYYVGLTYSEGRGVTQDFAEAARWYRRAADQGYASAQYNLGIAYGMGEGMPQDYAEAHMWLNLAASRASGDEQTKYANARNQVAEKMTSQQIADAQRRAREWKPRGHADNGRMRTK
jgi:uncharacterized protein